MNLLVCGVGGQGVLLFSDILAQLALTAGLDVKKSEVHGMAQRGGSVTSHIRWGEKIHSPLIEEGTADIIVAFELLEAVRYLHFLAPAGWLIYDPLTIAPLPVQLGLVEQIASEELEKRIQNRLKKSLAVRAFDTARTLGNPRVQNTVMLGAVSRLLEFPDDLYYQTIKQLVKPQFVEANILAFRRGQELVSK
ncbi:MAG: indolepyruvate oxidoreductase subunit beta [candidate division WOR-3 bacterium]|nr:indolepyruvate oxidoreductase subunit beta [candidate division WOR-3 bacterium]